MASALHHRLLPAVELLGPDRIILAAEGVLNRDSILNWGRKGFWAVMDQGLFALSNFVLNVLLARWMTPTDYGAFSVAYAIFLLLGTIHTSLLTEPMLVFGPGRYKDRVNEYLNVLLRGHWVFAGSAATLFAIVGFILWRFSDSALTPAVLGLAIASPFILFQWIMRRACYVTLRPRLAAYAGGLYAVVMGAGIIALNASGTLAATTALFVMAAASLASGTWLAYNLGVRPAASIELDFARESRKVHWNYGRWAIGTAVLMWIPGNVFLLLLPAWWGLEATAAYRAMLNLLLPIMNVTIALGGILLPSLVRIRARSDFNRVVSRLTLAFVIAPVVYWVLLGTFGASIVELLYGSRYQEYAGLLWLAGLIPVVAAFSSVAGAALRALELPNRVFFTYVFSAAVTLTIGVALARFHGIQGAMIGWLIAYIVTAILLRVFLQRRKVS